MAGIGLTRAFRETSGLTGRFGLAMPISTSLTCLLAKKLALASTKLLLKNSSGKPTVFPMVITTSSSVGLIPLSTIGLLYSHLALFLFFSQ